MINFLEKNKVLYVDINEIPNGWDLDEWLKYADNGIILVDSNKTTKENIFTELVDCSTSQNPLIDIIK